MKNRVSVTTALKAFNVITNNGVKAADGYSYKGIIAASDYDGYTVTLSDNLSKLTIYFHNKYELDGPDNKAMERLIKNVDFIAKG